MKAVLEIGTARYAFESVAKASKALELLSGAVQVDWNYHDGDYCFFPYVESSFRNRLELKIVNDDRFFSADPAKTSEPGGVTVIAQPVKSLKGFKAALLLTQGGAS